MFKVEYFTSRMELIQYYVSYLQRIFYLGVYETIFFFKYSQELQIQEAKLLSVPMKMSSQKKL